MASELVRPRDACCGLQGVAEEGYNEAIIQALGMDRRNEVLSRLYICRWARLLVCVYGLLHALVHVCACAHVRASTGLACKGTLQPPTTLRYFLEKEHASVNHLTWPLPGCLLRQGHEVE